MKNTIKPKLSIVVPVYNVENYLERCVNSLINQTFSNFEIILVDDGSPDRSGLMCDEYSKKDKRIHAVHKCNGGLSSARNAGMAVASGEYIGFVDSDDDVEPDMYEKLVNAAEEYQVDFVMADYLRIENDGRRFTKTLNIEAGYYDRQKIVDIILPNLIMMESIEYGPFLSVWHCLYRREFLKDHNLLFDDQIRWSEDNIFSAIMGYQCQSFYYLKGEALYHYYQNPGSITTSYRKGAWVVYSLMNRHLHDFFDQVTDYDFSRQLKLHLIYYACNCISQELTKARKEAIEGIKSILVSPQLTEAFKDLKIPDVPFKLKVQLQLMKRKQATLLYLLKKR
ncbi:MAG: glycosyltransferase [Erysipelotrichaceae bacterium]|nr:glycosyltransferase [Erysipelotrichaceae bacterium]